MSRTQRPSRTSASRKPATTTKPLRSTYGAEDGRRQMQEEARRQEARREAQKQRSSEPRRFWMKPGETRELIIVDEELSFFRYEHALRNTATGRFDLFVPCVNENANCPVCANSENKPSYFAAYLTVIDTTPYENSNGEVIEWSKRLMVIKPAQQKKYLRLQEREKSLRGLVIEVTRDRETDAAIGNDVECVGDISEDDLLAYETVYVDKDGKEHDVIGHEPFDYEEAFPEWTEKQLVAVAGGRSRSTMGNRDDIDRDLGRRSRRSSEEQEEDEDSGTRGRRSASRDSSRSGSRRAAREEPEEQYEEEEEAEEAEERTPRRSAGRTSARAASRSAPRRQPREEAEEPEYEEEEAEEQQTPRRSSRASSARSRDEYSVEDTLPDERPQRPARSGGAANRREALRRR
ncbi:hypothetical protein FDG94_gp042 [Pseudomonas phage SM1]|uniref:Uncharacterized protein n=2 Tax=Samunavirus TaxID=2560221 RepID=A0A0U3C8M2_9CAUD|nr:hypothetical protein FDG94_gp042 [Pseudomonas phage SM1]UGC97112.1 hypothetical protein [Pseudomonas phage BHU-1]UGV19929.1 hypothetical protein [Pseudomonas phage Pa BHU-15]UIW13631.1 hypothetical protein [Pseudomonas phage Pa BHU-17]UVN14083.1 hypothetical protein FBPa45_0081 [Pseudomonas phage vB_PaeS_FBPa45]HBO9768558.1 hypothetical protein [Pseudomonas aeruginosa]